MNRPSSLKREQVRFTTDVCFLSSASLTFLPKSHLSHEVCLDFHSMLPPARPQNSFILAIFSFVHHTYHVPMCRVIVVYRQISQLPEGGHLTDVSQISGTCYVLSLYLFHASVSVRMPLLCTWKATCCFPLQVGWCPSPCGLWLGLSPLRWGWEVTLVSKVTVAYALVFLRGTVPTNGRQL